MRRYNLIDEKWIPVRFPDGNREELGISETLLRAETIAAIEDPSPLVVAALHRFLLAVLYRALEGPTDINQAREWFKNGWPEQKIAAYLEKWRPRFWLYDEKFPFFQIPDYIPKEKRGEKLWRSWTSIAAEHNADNAKVLFDHTNISESGYIPTAMAVRWLLSCQTFAIGGGNSDFRYTKNGPSATSLMVIPLGTDLKDTLLFSLVPQNREVARTDTPVWERESEPIDILKQGISRPIMGYADLYSWRTRAVKFKYYNEGYSIAELSFASGAEYSSDDFIDPMCAYRVDEKHGRMPIRLRDRGIWRDFDSLLPDGSDLPPRVIEHALLLAKFVVNRFFNTAMILGQSNNKAKIEFWRIERFEMPKALLSDKYVKVEIKKFLNAAESAAKSIEKSLRNLARATITKGNRELQQDKWAAGKWIPGDVSKFIEKYSYEADPIPVLNYWSALEAHFHKILCEYTVNMDLDDIRCQWLKNIRKTLKKAWEKQYEAYSIGDAGAIRALVKAEEPIRRKLKELNEEIAKLEPLEEEA